MANPDGWYWPSGHFTKVNGLHPRISIPRQDIMTIEALDPDTLTWEVKFPVGLVVGPVGGKAASKKSSTSRGVPCTSTVTIIEHPNFG